MQHVHTIRLSLPWKSGTYTDTAGEMRPLLTRAFHWPAGNATGERVFLVLDFAEPLEVWLNQSRLQLASLADSQSLRCEITGQLKESNLLDLRGDELVLAQFHAALQANRETARLDILTA